MSAGRHPTTYILQPLLRNPTLFLDFFNETLEIQLAQSLTLSYRSSKLCQIHLPKEKMTLDSFGYFILGTPVNSSDAATALFKLTWIDQYLLLDFSNPAEFKINIDTAQCENAHVFWQSNPSQIVFQLPSTLGRSSLNPLPTEIIHTQEQLGNWYHDSPKTNRYVHPKLWDYHWSLYVFHSLPPTFSFSEIKPTQKPLILPCRSPSSKTIPLLTPSSLMMVEDLMWYRPDMAWDQLSQFFNLFRSSDGMFAHDLMLRAPKSAFPSSNSPTKNFDCSHPPLWSYFLLELAKLTQTAEKIPEYYAQCAQNLKWWETHRFYEDYHLFGSKLPVRLLAQEMNMDHSARFYHQYNGKVWKEVEGDQPRDMILIDLNAQLCDFYQNMGVLGMMVGDEDASQYFSRAEALQDAVQSLLWDPQTKFFYDFDLETQTRQPLKSVAGFWALFGGLASKGQVDPILSHLLNPEEFWTQLPLPAVARNDPFYRSEIGSGPVTLAQIYWLVIGLKRYGLHTVVSRLCTTTLDYLNQFFNVYHTLYEYYPATGLNLSSIRSQSSEVGHIGPLLGTNCIHPLFYRGILGAEILDSSINFVPDWTNLSKEVNFSFYYKSQKINSFMSKMKNKMLEFNF